MPLGKDVKKNMTELTDKHPDWTYKRRLAASLNAAREHGSRIPRRTKVSKTSYRRNRGRKGGKKIRKC